MIGVIVVESFGARAEIGVSGVRALGEREFMNVVLWEFVLVPLEIVEDWEEVEPMIGTNGERRGFRESGEKGDNGVAVVVLLLTSVDSLGSAVTLSCVLVTPPGTPLTELTSVVWLKLDPDDEELTDDVVLPVLFVTENAEEVLFLDELLETFKLGEDPLVVLTVLVEFMVPAGRVVLLTVVFVTVRRGTFEEGEEEEVVVVLVVGVEEEDVLVLEVLVLVVVPVPFPVDDVVEEEVPELTGRELVVFAVVFEVVRFYV